MGLLTDAAYAVAAAITMPVWSIRMASTGKLRTDWRGRFGDAAPWPRCERSRILIHAVSVGEAAAIRHLVAHLARGADAPEIIVSATTDTGIERARSLYAARHRIVRYPFDFSGSVRRFLDAVRPDVVALTELEVWPNFVAECARRGIPVAVVNGRLSDRSERRYRLLRPLLAKSFRSLSLVASQSEVYSSRFRNMGVPPGRVHRVGTMKWDTADIADDVPGASALADALQIDRSKPLVVAGSTAPGEHALIRDAMPHGAQLLCAPRRPEWFDAAARDLPGCVRRSHTTGACAEAGSAARRGGADLVVQAGGHATIGSIGSNRRYLLDSMGELRQAYALADLVIVGRTFGIGRRYGGSDMMEPVALGKATIVGPDVSNFEETAARLADAGGLVRCDASTLREELARLLADPTARASLAAKGRAVIREEQGASARTAELLRALLQHATGRGSRRSSPSEGREAVHV